MQPDILLVTYERNMAPIYREALTSIGFDVSWTYDEDRAISYIAQSNHHPDLVVIDHMPAIMNGILTMIEMHNIDPAMKIVLMGENRSVRGFALQQGAAGFVKKPHTIEKFLGMIERYASDEKESTVRKWISHGIERPAIEASTRAGSVFPTERNLASHGRQKKLRSHRNIASAFILLMIIIPMLVNAWTFMETPQPKSIIVVHVHSTYIMETKGFEIFMDNKLEYHGFTGGGHNARVTLSHSTHSIFPEMVNITVVSDFSNSSSQDSKMITVNWGYTYNVLFHV